MMRFPVALVLGTWALFLPLALPDTAAAEPPVQVFILAGQSNMEGKAKISLLEYQLSQPGTKEEFAHLRPDGKWLVRDDVWIKFLNRKGNLTVGYGSPQRIGPELEFGIRMGDHVDGQVLIIKTAWGGKSLFKDFRPPSAGLPAESVLKEEAERRKKKQPDFTLERVKGEYGQYYRLMQKEIADTLKNLKEHFPGYEGQGYELAGFVWFQGWNDMINDTATAEYADNMAHFIRDVRKDLKAPDLPFVIGVLGVGGTKEKPNAKRDRFKEAQAAPAKLPEFQGNVKVVATDVYWDEVAYAVFKKGWRQHVEEWEKVGSDYPFHYLGSVRTYGGIGAAFGKAMVDLDKDRPKK